MKKYGILFTLILSLLLPCAAVFCQENVTITTYYPAPFGVYVTLRTLNGNNEVTLNNDGGNPNIELRRVNAAGGTPYIDFTNDTATDFDWRFILQSDNQIWIRGGDAGVGHVTFADDTGAPGIIRVSEVWYCNNY
jgi:hypothetical protein